MYYVICLTVTSDPKLTQIKGLMVTNGHANKASFDSELTTAHRKHFPYLQVPDVISNHKPQK